MRNRPPLNPGKNKGEMAGTVGREVGEGVCLGAVAVLHPNTNRGQGLLAVKLGPHLSGTGDFYFFSCLSCV